MKQLSFDEEKKVKENRYVAKRKEGVQKNLFERKSRKSAQI